MNTELKGFIYAVLSAVTYSALGLFGQRIMDLGISNECMLLWRFVFSFLILAIFFPKRIWVRFRVKPSHAIVVVLSFVASAYFYFESTKRLGTGLAMTVFFIYPMLLAVLNRFILKEHLPQLQKIGMLLTFIAILFLSDFDFTPQGNIGQGFIFGLLGGLGYAIYIFGTRAVAMDSFALTAWVCLGSAFFFFVQSTLLGTLRFVPMQGLFDLFCITVLCTIIPMLLFIKAVHLIGSVKTSLLSIAEPPSTILLGMYFLNEIFSSCQIIGFVFMVASMLVIESDKFILLRKK